MDTKQQKRLLSSTSALLTACFSVSSSSRYLSLTSCMALSSWGCRSPRPEHKHVHIPRCIQFQLETASRPSQPLTNQLENSHFSLVTSCQLVSRPVNGCKSYRTKSLCLVWIGPALFQSLCPSLKHILVYSGGWEQGKTSCGNQAMKKRRNSKHSGKMLPSADESFSHRKYL